MRELRNLTVGRALSLDGNDIDTDRIIPARHMLQPTFEGLGAHVFEDDRRQLHEEGRLHPFDHPDRREARILLVDRNFGSGSSREHAPQALLRWSRGIAAIVGVSFSEIFAGNCVELGIPCVRAIPADVQALKRAVAAEAALEVVVDLEKCEVRAGSLTLRVTLPDGARRRLSTGTWDSTTELLEGVEQTADRADSLPYFNHWR